MAKHDIQLKEGDILKGRYQIIDLIGSGGMSAVYLAKELGRENQFWAVKVADMNRKISRRLFSEAKLLSELNHPSLPQIADFFSSEDERYFYLVQEYVNGQSLYQIFEQKESRMSEEEVIDFCLPLCDVLIYLHSRAPAIIYRDIKPANIMMTTQGELKLIDFGIARKYVSEKAKDTLQIGTVGFAAPEQFEKRQSDKRTDLFSLGALMYYLLSGGKYVYIAQKPIREYRTELTKSMKKCVDSLVQLDPEERLQSVEEVKELLLSAKRNNKVAKSGHRPGGWTLALKYVVSILIFLAVIGFIIFDYYF